MSDILKIELSTNRSASKMIMPDNIKYLTEENVVSLLSMPDAILALEHTLVSQGRQLAKNLPKSLSTWDDGSSMHALGSLILDRGYAGFKTWVHTKRGGGSVFTLFDADYGTLLAVIEARALGMLRTAAITGLATKILAPRNSRTAALIGTGPQAVTQLEAVACVLDLERVHVFSPTPEKRQAFVEKVKPKYGFEIVECPTLEVALSGAEVVTLITRAQEPFVSAAQLKDCKHLNAVGAILPTKAEIFQDVLGIASQIVVDDVENAVKGSRELREKFGTDASGWSEVQPLSALLANDQGRKDGSELTVFKGMGMGLSDLAMAAFAYDKAVEQGLGRELPLQTRKNLLLERA